ncbi:TetR family transcriptional regulator C-terminal domain-containing protein [Brevibacterium sp. SMBL_HHYL_HB1]|uniref:TetR family transcriptional regulator C-terminal domain-containing protein n=1 Tax=Brevibacterium sp. SMBL_HHYL_HB1 TaxID=2777556 RepID=UPI002012A6F5|nr:TetR family transcriptional regulator C-terminal domain-containing protein [Brevibacterium sp. SMBL_HHYL_HB1]
MEATLAAVEPSPAEVVAALLRTMIPRSPEDFRDLRVVTMFETMALTEPALGRALLEGHAELRRLLIDQVALVLRGPGSELEAAGTTSPETLSDGLLATAGGLAIEVLHGHLGSDEANRVLDAALACGLGKYTANGTEAGHDT